MFMRRRAFFLAPLMFLLLALGLGSLAGRARTNDAYEAGFAAGQASTVVEEGAASEGASTNANADRAYYGPGYGYHGFGFFGFFFKMIFFIFFFGFLFRLFGFWRWRRWHARRGGGHHGPWHRGGPRSPQGDEGPREKQPQDIDPNTYYV